MKEKYESPELEIIRFTTADVIEDSNPLGEDEGPEAPV